MKLIFLLLGSLVTLMNCSTSQTQQITQTQDPVSTPIHRAPALSDPFPVVSPNHLFSSYTPLQIELSAPLSTLFKAKTAGFLEAKKAKVSGTMTFSENGGEKKTIKVELKLKGTTTLTVCAFPKMEMKFLEGAENTPFAGMKAVDFHTHCAEPNDASVTAQFRASYHNHREALLYRMMDVLGMPGLKARPVTVHYDDTASPSTVVLASPWYEAFFLEDMGDLRKRLNATEVRDANDPFKIIDIAQDPKKASWYTFESLDKSPKIDLEDASRVSLFQKMIGNGDWFIKVNAQHFRNPGDKTALWNSKIIEIAKKKWVLFPQDFSLSAMVLNLNFPANEQTVWQVSNTATREKIKTSFLARKAGLDSAIDSTLENDSAGRAFAHQYIDQFFSQIGSY